LAKKVQIFAFFLMESIFPVCDKPYHKTKENMPLREELENCGTIH